MRTTKPISTISYNSVQYLCLKLEELRKAHIIEFWAFIEHQPEGQETKAHKHVYIEPAKMVQTEEIREELRELDIPKGDGSILGCMPFQSSKFDDWYMYGLHDEAYLLTKGEVRQIHYSHSDFYNSDTEYFDERVRTINVEVYSIYKRIKNAVEQGFTWTQVLTRGIIPMNLLNVAHQVYDAYRNDLNAKKHDNRVSEYSDAIQGQSEREKSAYAHYSQKCEWNDEDSDELPMM